MLKRDVPVRMPEKPPSMIGFGPTAKRVLLVGFLIAVLAGLGFLPLLETQFSSKTAAKVACNEMVRYREYDDPNNFNPNRPPEGSENWRRKFLSTMRGIGVKLSDEQYSFSVTQENKNADHLCHVQVAFDKKGKWPLISDFIDDLPPLVHKVRLDFVHAVRNRY
jgi:hypothetical protein